MAITRDDLLRSGVSAYRGQPVAQPCDDCPFKPEAEGQGYLRPGRLEEIRMAEAFGQPFWCHKTVYNDQRTEWVERDDGGEGPLAFQHRYHMCRGALEDHTKAMAELEGTDGRAGKPCTGDARRDHRPACRH